MKVAVYAKTEMWNFAKSSFSSRSLPHLAQHSLNVLPWFTHKSAPFCRVQVYDITVFDEHHLDHYQFINDTRQQP